MKKKKKSVQARLSENAYKIVRGEAYRQHRPMTDILDEMIQYFKDENIPLSKQ